MKKKKEERLTDKGGISALGDMVLEQLLCEARATLGNREWSA